MRRLLVLCCAVVFLDAAFFAAVAPLLPSLKSDLGIGDAQAGLLSASYAAGILLLAIPGGVFASRKGPRRGVLLGLVGMGIFSVAFGFAGSLGPMTAARFGQGASGALMWAGAMGWVISTGSPERRGVLVGILVGAATVGELLGAPIGALAYAVGRDLVFASVGAVSALLFVGAWFEPDPPLSPASTARELLSRVPRTGIVMALWMLTASAIAFGAATVIAPLRLDDLGASAAMIAAAFAAGSLVETILGPQVGRVSDRVGRALPYSIGAATGAVAIVVMALAGAMPTVFAAMVALAFAAGLGFTPAMALVADRAENAQIDQAFASGMTNVAFGGGQMIGAGGTGLLAAGGYLLPALLVAAALAHAGFTARRALGG